MALLSAKREVSEEVDLIAADIIADVREKGDAAVSAALQANPDLRAVVSINDGFRCGYHWSLTFEDRFDRRW